MCVCVHVFVCVYVCVCELNYFMSIKAAATHTEGIAELLDNFQDGLVYVDLQRCHTMT